ncbi:hypothetical protein QOZ84_07820 [Romboutsia sedimentorum]|uniref:Uncharacterized protein n=1 Tax=Romboutsia sedimentorum TaxID=1368474 RepID=A0ABT7E961_9FIRM|nr:hypothetical protein [Romboutsia sedimentorum]MDK2563454.1 hypothetical protein [Romboutsia sedimentorum]MDK2585177.1 hypothetical protein [Romboutsia sedimentorum]
MKFKEIDKLSPEKYKLIQKYSLSLNDSLIWEFKHDKYYTTKYFSNKFAVKQSTLALLFNIHRLCYAKIKYFEHNFHKYKPYKYNFKVGFFECELFDMEFILHKPSNIIIDIRNLQEIKDINKFKDFCNYLETFEIK